jgi:dolichol-phosphate hexosyltransferase
VPELRMTRKSAVPAEACDRSAFAIGACPRSSFPDRMPFTYDAAFKFDSLKLSILMPVYNEQRTILEAVSDILAVDYPCDFELIVVDDGSTDQTPALLRRIDDGRVTILRHSQNQGKGAALRSALSIASGTHVLPFDADLEYVPEDIPKMLRPVMKGRCHVVYGVRLFGCNTVYQSYRYAVGNRFLTRAANVLFDASLSDLHTCLKLMPLALMTTFNLTQDGFGMDTELTAMLLRCGIRPFEVPVSYYSRSREQGKKITWRDAVVCLRILFQVRMRGNPCAKLQPSLRGDDYVTDASHAIEPEPESELQRKQRAPTILLDDAEDSFALTRFQHGLIYRRPLRETGIHGSRRVAASQEPRHSAIDNFTT